MEYTEHTREIQLGLLADVLVAAGVELRVVGSFARWLNGDAVRARDLDVVIADTPSNRCALSSALDAVAVGPTRFRGIAGRASPLQFTTGFGPLDVFFA